MVIKSNAAPCYPNRLLRLPDVSNVTGQGKTAIYALIKQGKLCRPVKIGRSSAWPENEVLAFVESCIESRGT